MSGSRAREATDRRRAAPPGRGDVRPGARHGRPGRVSRPTSAGDIRSRDRDVAGLVPKLKLLENSEIGHEGNASRVVPRFLLRSSNNNVKVANENSKTWQLCRRLGCIASHDRFYPDLHKSTLHARVRVIRTLERRPRLVPDDSQHVRGEAGKCLCIGIDAGSPLSSPPTS